MRPEVGHSQSRLVANRVCPDRCPFASFASFAVELVFAVLLLLGLLDAT